MFLFFISIHEVDGGIPTGDTDLMWFHLARRLFLVSCFFFFPSRSLMKYESFITYESIMKYEGRWTDVSARQPVGHSHVVE